MSAEVDVSDSSALQGEDSTQNSVPQFLTFIVANSAYGIPIGHVAEIIGAQRLTAVPDPRPYMRGVINLRGTVIPVMDVRSRLEMESREIDERTCIVVVKYEEFTVGLLVDTISDVIDVPHSSVEAAPKRKGACMSESIVTGLVQIDDEVKILIDLGHLFA